MKVRLEAWRELASDFGRPFGVVAGQPTNTLLTSNADFSAAYSFTGPGERLWDRTSRRIYHAMLAAEIAAEWSSSVTKQARRGNAAELDLQELAYQIAIIDGRSAID